VIETGRKRNEVFAASWSETPARLMFNLAGCCRSHRTILVKAADPIEIALD
jgi:hypothetical protein